MKHLFTFLLIFGLCSTSAFASYTLDSRYSGKAMLGIEAVLIDPGGKSKQGKPIMAGRQGAFVDNATGSSIPNGTKFTIVQPLENTEPCQLDGRWFYKMCIDEDGV